LPNFLSHLYIACSIEECNNTTYLVIGHFTRQSQFETRVRGSLFLHLRLVLLVDGSHFRLEQDVDVILKMFQIYVGPGQLILFLLSSRVRK
jgi:hypothetical protein